MKILFVDQTGQLGGGELSLLDLIRGGTHTAEVALFSDGPFRRLLGDASIPVHLLESGKATNVRREAGFTALLSALPSLVRLRNRLSRISKKFDVIYANSQKAFIVSALAKRRDQVLVWHLRDMLSEEHFSGMMRRLSVLTGNTAADLIVANSQATRESLIASGGSAKKTIVIYNGIDSTPFDRVDDASIALLRKDLGLEGKFVIGAFGRLSPWKGQTVLVDALASLPEAHAIIVGDALFGEKDFADSLRARVHELSLDSRVHFLGFRSDIAELMRSVDVIAHTATAPEPFGRVIVEGMLARKPVIATRAGGALEILRDGETGLLVTPGDVRALHNAIVLLKSDEALRNQLAEQGRRAALQEFSVERMVRSVESELETIHRPIG